MKHSFFTFLFACFVQLMFAVNLQPVNSVFNLGMNSNSYEVEFNLPKYNLVTTEAKDCGIFTSIEFQDDSIHSMLDDPGLPILPLFNLMLELPSDAYNIRINILDADSEYVKVVHPILPTRIEHYRHGEIVGVDCYDSIYYEKGYGWKNQKDWVSYLCNEYDSITGQFYTQHIVYDTIRYRRALGISLTIIPMIYSVTENELNVLDYAHIIIEFDTKSSIADMISQHFKDNRFRDQCIEHYFDTYTNLTIPKPTGDMGTYLIFVPQRIIDDASAKDSLIAFENHKTALGYNVVTHTYQNGQSRDYFIYEIQKYDPDYILLCGAKSDIPEASFEDGIYSDREYSINDAAIGRWIIPTDKSSSNAFKTIVHKTIKSERNYSNVGNASLFSGTDSSPYMRWEFNRVVNYVANSFRGTTIGTTTTDGTDTIANINRMISLIHEGVPQLFLYAGHGNKTLIGGPYFLYASNISLLNNDRNNFLPMGFGFACLLNDYTVADCFGERWLTDICGGVTFYGAITESYTAPNFYLAKNIFDRFRDDIDHHQTIQMGQLVYDASKRYYDICKTCVRKRQYRKYIFLGDPTISVFGINHNNTLRPALIPQKEIETLNQEAKVISHINLYNIMGMYLTTLKTEAEFLLYQQTPNHALIAQIFYTDNSTYTLKLIR